MGAREKPRGDCDLLTRTSEEQGSCCLDVVEPREPRTALWKFGAAESQNFSTDRTPYSVPSIIKNVICPRLWSGKEPVSSVKGDFDVLFCHMSNTLFDIGTFLSERMLAMFSSHVLSR